MKHLNKCNEGSSLIVTLWERWAGWLNKLEFQVCVWLPEKNKIIWINNKYSFAFILLWSCCFSPWRSMHKNLIPPKYCEHLRSCAWTSLMYSINNTSLWHRYLCFCLNDSREEFTHSLVHMYTHQRTFGFVAKSLYRKLTRIIECVYRENFPTELVSALRRTLDPVLNVNLSLVCQNVCRESSEGKTATQKRDKNEGKECEHTKKSYIS